MKQKCGKVLRSIWEDIRKIRWALAALAVYYAATGLLFRASCPMRLLTGFPCPGCGGTRAAVLLLQGRFQEAFGMNPAVFVWIPYVLYLLWQRYLGAPRNRKKINFALTALVCLVTVGCYAAGMASGFPLREPYTYYRGNLMRMFAGGASAP
ncbi:MAG: DUF2752 domain-containing protein [Lachnospiraceae bacterium]|nr:DUF2752 domain-containing protein [Lachnospiraceae bacterium]